MEAQNKLTRLQCMRLVCRSCKQASWLEAAFRLAYWGGLLSFLNISDTLKLCQATDRKNNKQ